MGDLTSEPDAKRPRVETETKLFSYWRSSCSYRARIVLNLKQVPYHYTAVHLLKEGGQQFKPEYVALNPSKEVPTLLIDGLVLGQSTAIVEYLEETRPERPLLPKDPFHRAIVRQVCAVVSNDIQPLGNVKVLKHITTLAGDTADKEKVKLEWLAHYISGGFETLESLLAKHAGRFSVGDEVTLADAFLVPQVYNAHRFKIDMTPYPTINKVCENLKDIPEFVKAHPSNQPDAEKE
jgi:maleylacetoacetate isomerase